MLAYDGSIFIKQNVPEANLDLKEEPGGETSKNILTHFAAE